MLESAKQANLRKTERSVIFIALWATAELKTGVPIFHRQQMKYRLFRHRRRLFASL